MGTAARVGARLGPDDISPIASVCDHLDGHPLSIELAAAQLVEAVGGEVSGLGFLLELSFLEGRSKLDRYHVESLMTY